MSTGGKMQFLMMMMMMMVMMMWVTEVKSYTFFHISDLHYDPIADPISFNFTTFCRSQFLWNESLRQDDKHFHGAKQDSTKHNQQFEEEVVGRYGRYGCDSSASLISSTLNAMQSVNPSPDFIIYTGDSAAQYSAVLYVAQAIKEAFPKTMIIPSLGNNDVFPDYEVVCGDVRLKGLYDIYSDWIPPDQVDNFLEMGAYNTSFDGGRLKIIALNTLLYSVRGIATGNDPCGQFSWLKNQLNDAIQTNSRVYITGHVLPGVDAYSYRALWDTEYNSAFLSILSEYDSVIDGIFFGHIHRDEFRVISNQASPLTTTAMLITSAVSPVYDNNPSFRIYQTNSSFSLLDYEIYYMDLYLANAMNQSFWTQEYVFSQAYGQKSLETEVLEDLWNTFQKNASWFAAWNARRTAQYVDTKVSALCVMSSPDPASYVSCVSSPSA
eukprot:TRINITY_DN1009_c1_g1_i1.p1 TRINITY_DN1009_c1_g1~~TRINITY_DN1009_c1_g1_i1.p1  ORF type:complete len:437 (-),score=74.16 TRINITY_DN1009_c1_g1_i1:74-1384(-)